MKSILLIRYSALGDVVLATSVVAPLREKYPGVHIEWLVADTYAPLLEGVVDRIVSFNRHQPSSRAQALAAVKGRFDVCLDFQHKLWSMRVAHAAAPTRWSFVRRTSWQSVKSLFGHDTVLDSVPAVELYAQAAKLNAPGTVRLFLQPQAQARAAELMGPGRWVAVAPGAAWETKRWSAARFGEVAKALQQQGWSIALLGGPMDQPLLDAVQQVCTVDVDVTRESLPVLAAVLARSELMIGNDSGLVHVAQAVGTVPLALFGPTSVRRWGPEKPGLALSLGLQCAPCSNHGTRECPLGHHDCLKQLEVSRVLVEARHLLATRRQA